MFGRNNHARMERNEQRLDAGFVSGHYPGVQSIVISMVYNQRGLARPIHRTVHFSPSSYAFFRVDCLSDNCSDGGFDLTHVIKGMIRNHSESAKGELTCESDRPPVDHSDIEYDIRIKFL